MGLHIDLSVAKILKYMKTKIVRYCCGNNYIVDSEKILYSQHSDRYLEFNYTTEDDKYHDEKLGIPQHTNTQKYYWKTLYRAEHKVVPLIWSNVAI